MITIHCTYCWTTHYARSLQFWIDNNRKGCGKDRGRYFSAHADYIAYVRAYEQNGNNHPVAESWNQLSYLDK